MNRRTLAVLVLLLLAVACGKDKSPTGPTVTPPPPTTNPTPTPPAVVSMDGTVKETAPTAGTAIVAATLRIGSGESAGTTTTSDGNGYFIFRDIRPGNFSVEVSANGYDGAATGVSITTNGTRNFNLRPNLRTITQTITGSVNGGSPRCPDFYSTSSLPCEQYPIATHHNGRLTAVLTWGNSRTDLELALLKAPRANPDDRLVIARSGLSTREEISLDLTAGVQYYLHVLYSFGSTVEPFTLTLSRPN